MHQGCAHAAMAIWDTCPMTKLKNRKQNKKKTHCKEDPIYLFLEIILRGLDPNIHIHTPVSDLLIPRISSPILLQPNRQTYPGNI
jgi:hypothetical protein